MTRWWHELSSAQRHAVGRAVRAAVVVPCVFAFTTQVIGSPQMSLFSAFGSFALLLMADFGGPTPARLMAYAGLAVAGTFLVTIGTVFSQNPVLSAVVTALVAFAILFAGVINGYFATATTAAVLTFVLPISIPVDVGLLPDRLAGWGLACLVGIPAALFLWPDHSGLALRAAAGDACLAVAARIDPGRRRGSTGEGLPGGDLSGARTPEVRRLHDLYVSTPYRPTGASGQDRAVARLVHELSWLDSLVGPAIEAPEPGEQDRPVPLRGDERAHLTQTLVGVLRAGGERLRGGTSRPDIDALEGARTAMADAILREIGDPSDRGPQDDEELLTAIEPALRLRAVSYAALAVAVSAVEATRSPRWGVRPRSLPGMEDQATPVDPTDDLPAHVGSGPGAPRTWARAVGSLLRGYASPRSVWFRNSVRGAVGLAGAVLVAHLADVEHSFWVVLATLSVLRSTTMGLGSTVVRTLLGTVVGVVVGGVLIVVLGDHSALLWVLLPLAVMFTGYAPGVLSFATGQAAFSLMVLILFNLIQPAGWQVGLVRIEDIALGCAISLVAGLLFWPRGVRNTLAHNASTAFVRTIDYLAASVRRLSRDGGPEAGDLSRAARSAVDTGRRLDDAFRHYLASRAGGQGTAVAATLVAGVHRIRFAAHSLAGLAASGAAPSTGLGPVEPKAAAIQSWYHTFAASLVARAGLPTPETTGRAGRIDALRCLREAAMAGRGVAARHGIYLMWANQQLEEIRELEAELASAASDLEQAGRRGRTSRLGRWLSSQR